ncbi:MAG TPA: rhomboid family intramembrane serine protease [Candidatus Elarobacter sp.]|nr:rhomboid family intramembrane serine protease [Candidatus Elarobacter sp.]
MSLTNILVAINVVAFLWQMTTFGGPDYDHGYLYGPDVVQHGQWWRIVTAAFLHGSIPHVLLNMVALFQVGNIVESMFGKPRFALLYAISIVGSGLAVLYFNYGVPTLGASGAIFGLFGALVAVGLRLGPRGRALIAQVLPVIVINLLFTFSVPGISAAAHVGGLITGFLAGLLLYMVPGRRQYAYAYAPANDPGARTIEQRPDVETIEQPPHAGPHEEAGAPPLEVRDPQE